MTPASAATADRRSLRGRLGVNTLVPAVTTGIVLGALEVVLAASFAALIFRGALAPHLPAGIGLGLFAALVIVVVVSLRSSLPAAVASVQDSTAAVMALVAASIASSVAPGADAFLTVVVAIASTTVFTGGVLLALGLLGLANLIRYVPYPVVGGFLAGTGWLITTGAIGVLTGISPSSDAGALFAPEVMPKWVAGLALAVVLLVLTRRVRHVTIIPAAVVAAVALFYLVLGVTGTSIATAEAGGWLLGPFPASELWQPWVVQGASEADWQAIATQVPAMAAVAIVAVIALLLNTTGIELAVDRDIDLDQELRAAGAGNLLAGLGGGIVGFHALSLTSLAARSGGGRGTAIVAALVCAGALLLGAGTLSLLPRVALGGLLLFLGLSFLVEWLYDAWSRLPRSDYALIVLILAVVGTFGFLHGVAVGIGLALLLFVIDHSRTNVVKHAFSGTSYRSRVERDAADMERLRAVGDELAILELHGSLFFGTANALLERVRARALDPDRAAVSWVVLDFRRVSGIDTSAVVAFIRVARLAGSQGITLAASGLSDGLRSRLARGGFSPEALPALRVFPDLDHAVESWEEIVLARHVAERDGEGPRPVDTFAALVRDRCGLSVDGSRLLHYLEPLEVPAGHVLIRQGEASRDLFLLASGRLTAVFERTGGQRVRLRTMGPGTVVGEITMYLGSARTASVISDEPCRLYRLSQQALEEMERVDPALAADVHRAFARLLAGRLTDLLGTLEAALD